MLNIAFPRPHQLHRAFYLFRNQIGFSQIVPLVATTKRATGECQIHDDFLWRYASQLSDLGLCNVRDLRWRPNLNVPILVHVYGGVHRLHSGVSLEGHFIIGFDRSCRISNTFDHISMVGADHSRRTICLFTQLLLKTSSAFLRTRGLIPDDFQSFLTLEGCPG